MIDPPVKLQKIAEIIDGQLKGGALHQDIQHVITDSRTYVNQEHTLFVSLPGMHRDGRSFIPELLSRGVKAFIVANEPEEEWLPNAAFIVVKDSLLALQKLAAYHRSRFDLPIIAITGSNGKTIVKEWLYEVLRFDYNIARSPKSFNSQIGVPLSVLQINKHHTLAIIEAGVSRADEMRKLQEVIKPTLGIFTNIGKAHNAGFESMEHKAQEKAVLFQDCPVIYCNDDPILPKILGDNTLSWGHKEDGTVVLKSTKRKDDTTKIHYVYKGQQHTLLIPFADAASLENAMQVLTCALQLGLEPEVVADRMVRLAPVAMRLELLDGVNNCTILNDAYNSDLGSLDVALVELYNRSQGKKRTVILSDILQDKTPEKELYQKVARLMQEKGVQRIIGVGPVISRNKSAFHHLESAFLSNSEEFLMYIDNIRFNNEIILVKGARDFRFERIVDVLQKKSNPTVLEINLSAVEHNINEYRKLIDNKTKLMVMVKAYGYGAGYGKLGMTLQNMGVDYLGVAHIDEGVEIRKMGVTLPIIVMNPEEHGFGSIIEHELEPAIFSVAELDAFIRALILKEKTGYPIHVKIDTGMHRLGFSPDNLGELIALVNSQPEVKVSSVYTHLAASDNARFDEFTKKQLREFNEAAGRLETSLGYKLIKHALNTTGIERFPKGQLDMVRLGIGLFGVSSNKNLELRTVCTLKTNVIQIKEISSGETIGYNRAFKANESTRIAVLPIGYADGLRRSLSNGVGKVVINEKQFPIVGNVCMDMCMVDIGKEPVHEGQEVEIFGQHLTLHEMAELMQTIPYEVLTSVSERVKRVYITD